MVNPGTDVAVLLQQGLTFHHQGRLDDARTQYGQVLQQQAENADAWHLLGVLLGAQGQTALSIEHLQQAVRLRPDFAAAYNSLGNAYRACAQWDAAVGAYRAALAVRPNYAAALNNLACVLKALNQLPAAVALLQRAVEIDPNYAEAYFNLGNAFIAAGEYPAALTAYLAALALRPDDVEVLLALAKGYHRNSQSALALAVLARVMELAPQSAEAYNTLGAVREQGGEFDAARAAYRHAINLEPGLAGARFNLGTTELRLGNFQAGWQGYAYRATQAGVKDPRSFSEGSASAETLAGKSVLLHAEQGLGDTLQFARFAPLLVQTGVTTGIVVQRPLKTLLSASFVDLNVFAAGEPLPAADEHWPLMSMPLVFGTTLLTLPAPVGYVRAPQADVARWACRLPPLHAGGLRIGVAWSGNPSHENDRQRSIPLDMFAMLMAGVDNEFFSLQKEIRPADLAVLRTSSRLLDLSAEICDFTDTASIVANLDLVITVDTSVAHLVGAMGKPVWVLLPFVAEWRWLFDREDSPWYPTMRLFRQRTPGDWPDVLRRVTNALPPFRSGAN